MRNLKKVIALVAVFAMLISTVAFAQAFKDVAPEDAYSEAIETLSKLSILTGDDQDGDGQMEFRPNDTITRAEISTIVSRIQGFGDPTKQATSFTDVPADNWASGYIAQAAGQGIVQGYGDGTFGPENPVLYEEIVTMLMRTLGWEWYAKENGGYPTGYLAAAQKAGVLEGASGSVGAEAPRGLVAQLTYNAIDAPLMERYLYGTGDAVYIICDGNTAGYPRKTLMSENLDIVKLRGRVTQNNVTDLNGNVSIDTSARQTIKFEIYDNYDMNTADYPVSYSAANNYSSSVKTFYTEESGADAYLGLNSVLYVKEAATGNETPEIISITEASGKNTTVEFSLADYENYVTDSSRPYIEYMKNATDRNATKLTMQNGDATQDKDIKVIYNGIGGYSMENIDSMIKANPAASGKMTVVDTGEITGYDLVVVELAASAVVDEVTSKNTITFLNNPGDDLTNTNNKFNRIYIDEDDTTSIVNITKDGAKVEPSELSQWDVLSVIYNRAAENVYDVRVIGDTAVTGTITQKVSSDTSADGYAYEIDGVRYDRAPGFYTNGTLDVGNGGKYYIDDYGKIVAYDRNNSPDGSNDDYAYVLGYSMYEDFGTSYAKVNMLTADGSVYGWRLANTVTVEQGSNTGVNKSTWKNTDSDFEANVASMVGQVITFSLNGSQYIKSIDLAYESSSYESGIFTQLNHSSSVNFDEDKDRIEFYQGSNRRTYTLGDDTLVFFIGKDGDSYTFGESVDDSDKCKVGTSSEIATFTGVEAVAYDETSGGDLKVLVLYNTDGGTAASDAVAVINSVGTSVIDGDDVYTVEYYKDGELASATTDPDLDSDVINENTKKGSIFKLTVKNGVITSASSYLDLNKDRTSRGDKLTVNSVKTGVKGDEEFYFGPAVEYRSGNKQVGIFPYDEVNGFVGEFADLQDLAEYVKLNASGINYYTFDPALRDSNRLSADSDYEVDKYITGEQGNTSVTINGVQYNTPAFEYADYMFVRIYNGAVADVVIYKAPDTGNYTFD